MPLGGSKGYQTFLRGAAPKESKKSKSMSLKVALEKQCVRSFQSLTVKSRLGVLTYKVWLYPSVWLYLPVLQVLSTRAGREVQGRARATVLPAHTRFFLVLKTPSTLLLLGKAFPCVPGQNSHIKCSILLQLPHWA